MTYFTFYCLVKLNDSYILKPYINIYNNMIEVIQYKHKS
jgi:hypothetical protein